MKVPESMCTSMPPFRLSFTLALTKCTRMLGVRFLSSSVAFVSQATTVAVPDWSSIVNRSIIPLVASLRVKLVRPNISFTMPER